MNQIIFLLLIVPLVFSLLYILCDKSSYKFLSYVLFLIGTTLSILLILKGSQIIQVQGLTFKIIEGIITISELAILVFLYVVSIKHKRWLVLSLTVVQNIITFYTMFFMPKAEVCAFNVDKLSMVMALIVNIIGTLIVIFANGYITKYEEHRKMKSKQKLFYSVICIFLSAMNGLILSDGLSWIYFFWEITTLSSFILISYNGDEEAYNSGFTALYINLIGGISFAVGNILFKNLLNIDSLSGIIQHGRVGVAFSIPVFLLCIAGFTKSAQMPFQSWLLGAMVAPTPVSALLHSSTMVKAGVYLIVKLSPAYAGTRLGTAIAIYGGFTFLICSAIAVSQRNAKRVLAYSTIANLGLIICSAGMGTSVAISAAMILIIFHSISKALLFLCTGQIEHIVGSRDIEDMAGLVHVAPTLAIITCFGIVSMILPPFGVLVTKWISIEAAASNPFISIFLVLGSALTTLFWVKWMGSLLSYPINDLAVHDKRDFSIYFPLWMLSIGVLLTSIFISPIFDFFVSPEVSSLLKINNDLSVVKGTVTSNLGIFNDNIVFLVLAIVIIVAILIKKLIVTSADIKNIYMCGENNSEDGSYFRGSNGTIVKANVSNFYLTRVLNENTITNFGYIVSISIMIIVLLGGLI